MLKAKDGEFFISDWLRNRDTVEFLGIGETVHNPGFNSGEFAIIRLLLPRQQGHPADLAEIESDVGIR